MEDDIKEDQKRSDSVENSTVVGDHGKLWIKLKISPSSTSVDDKNQQGEEDLAKDEKQLPILQSNKNTTRICEVCGKVLKSGKALGGHMRVHFQAHKDFIFTKKLVKSGHQKKKPFIKFMKKKKRKGKEVAKDFSKKNDHLISSSNGNHDSAAADANPTCSICGKNFSSMKSLFGHMRCHPEREWRGIQPPPWAAAPAAALIASPLSSVSDAHEPQKTQDDYDDDEKVDLAVSDGDQKVDLVKSLGGWSVTAKRGRKATVENYLSEEEEEEEEEEEDDDDDERMLEAVSILLRLAQGGDSAWEDKLVLNEDEVEEFEATNSNSLTNYTKKKGIRREFSADDPVKELRNIEGRKMDGNYSKAVPETGFFAGKSINLGCQWEGNTLPKHYYGGENFSKEDESEDSEDTRDDQLPIRHLKNSERTNKGNVDNVKSTRKKRKKMKLKDLDESVLHDDDVIASPVNDNQVLTLAKSCDQKYRCNICGKSFSTHQALGGHMSSHNKFRMNIQNSFAESNSPTPIMEDCKETDEGPVRCFPNSHEVFAGQVEGPSSQVTSAGEVSHTGRKLVGIDLNELPSLCEEDAAIESDDLAAASYECASSSYKLQLS